MYRTVNTIFIIFPFIRYITQKIGKFGRTKLGPKDFDLGPNFLGPNFPSTVILEWYAFRTNKLVIF